MSALAASGLVFVLTSGGILLGALLRRTLPRHHLNEHAKDVVRLGDHVVLAIPTAPRSLRSTASSTPPGASALKCR
jgi:hypothetical protein